MACISPVAVKDTTGATVYGYIKVPCGKCYECRESRSASWAFRLGVEDRYASQSLFVTLTYSDENLKWVGLAPTLDKSDLQKFFKRLRKNSRKKVKYYACGEYGGDSKRPHYHAIIFGADYDDIERSWSLGNIHFGEVSAASIRYVTNYLCKSVHTDFGDLSPEFAVMSKRLGAGYMTKDIIAWHHVNMANYVVLENGKRQQLPRYFKQKIFDEYQRAAIAVQHANEYELSYQEAVKRFGSAYALEESQLVNTKAAIERANYKQKQRQKL